MTPSAIVVTSVSRCSVQKPPPSRTGSDQERQVMLDVLGRSEFGGFSHGVAFPGSCSRDEKCHAEHDHRHDEGARKTPPVHDALVRRQHQPESADDHERPCAASARSIARSGSIGPAGRPSPEDQPRTAAKTTPAIDVHRAPQQRPTTRRSSRPRCRRRTAMIAVASACHCRTTRNGAGRDGERSRNSEGRVRVPATGQGGSKPCDYNGSARCPATNCCGAMVGTAPSGAHESPGLQPPESAPTIMSSRAGGRARLRGRAQARRRRTS